MCKIGKLKGRFYWTFRSYLGTTPGRALKKKRQPLATLPCGCLSHGGLEMLAPLACTSQRPKVNYETTHVETEMHRIIYSLKFDLEPGPDGQRRQLLAPLDRHGQSPHCRPEGKRRVIDLRDGDWVRHGKNRYRIRKVSSYRDAFTDTLPEAEGDGYVLHMNTKPK
jgi:hypothetical protein